jgi:predicted short-subunit dehydrogenase-like oxidoreductase (DUF2520 family)
MTGPITAVVIVGKGRMGSGLAHALEQSGIETTLVGRSRRPADTRAAGLVLIATPDDAIGGVAAELARSGAIGPSQTVLHLSGLLDRLALHALADSGAALGSFHPLQSVADPETARERLAGAYAGLEGDERALEAGAWLAATLGMRAVRLPPGGKPSYHAGAVLASNYLVVLASLAERLARAAGVPPADAARLYLPLMHGTVANLALGPVDALTGPVRRGDEATVRSHLAVLNSSERRLYRVLGLEALRLARQAGLADSPAAAVERALTDRD